jgi:plastocyanin
MRKSINLGLLLILLLGIFNFAIPAYASTPQNYEVLVGSEDTSSGVSLMSYFPQTVQLHVGDTVTWKANSHEIHTVTFLAGETLQDLIIPAPGGMASPLQVNPIAAFPITPANGQYDGTSYVNSGILSVDPGFIPSFSLTFTHEGVFQYVCYVHGMMMSGTIVVVGANVAVPTPAQVQAQAQAELNSAWHDVPPILAKAKAQHVPTKVNPDGTLTHTIIMGYESGNVMVMGFFPARETVHAGDTVLWKLSPTNTAPHTITFLNGAPDQSFAIIAQGQSGPVVLINPAVLFPSQAVLNGTPLNNTDFFNSGILMPGGFTTFSLKVGSNSGTLNYQCLLHDTSGMTGSLFVVPGGGN